MNYRDSKLKVQSSMESPSTSAQTSDREFGEDVWWRELERNATGNDSTPINVSLEHSDYALPPMNDLREHNLLLTRRHFFGRMATGIGTAALGSLLNPSLFAAMAGDSNKTRGLSGFPNFAPKAKRIIWLFMAGGPSQMDLLDYKPALEKLHQKALPESVRMG